MLKSIIVIKTQDEIMLSVYQVNVPSAKLSSYQDFHVDIVFYP
jgi:hypothetical protein